MTKFAKAVVGGAGALVAWAPALDGGLTQQELLVGVCGLLIASFGVYATPNKTP